ncbi:Solute-binding protein [Tepidimonas alkaliphilus]|uniref:Solute-binding protein n=1 Tax=Tepidimonas alkaliphilus TaxID=2588942 RepID=A0A554W8H8_9BURK|nr:TRAP transporter substrate-binding protein [Tepidimonas alkaliphilus]TSE19877.1 Solute-binding protein [Tepidimonas alkaliphilus]
MDKRTTLKALAAAAAATLLGSPAWAQQVTLRVHHFLPAQSAIPRLAIEPWARKVEAESGGRIKVQIFPAMQLGGSPAQLFDQARDGVADVTWTVLGYTPGRFQRMEVFEIPFIAPSHDRSAEVTSKAAWDFAQKFAAEEFKDVKLLAVHTHGPGLIHTKQPVTGLESLRGMKIRGGTRIVNNMLVKLGATPVGMPVPQVTEALSKGVLDGTTIPWEVGPSLRIHEIVKNHTTFAGDRALYTMGFAFSMNKAKYESLPPDLKKVIDNNSGAALSAAFGKAMDEADKTGREIAVKAGNRINLLELAETQRWLRTASSVEDDWIKEMRGKGIDGEALLKEARALIRQHDVRQ